MITIEIRQRDWMPAYGAYVSEPGGFVSPARILLNVDSILQEVDASQMLPEEVWACLMDTLVHELGHAIESYLKLEFSEERVEGYVAAYRALRETDLRDRVCPECMSSGHIEPDGEQNEVHVCPSCGGSGLKDGGAA